ncbi:MAG TPA: diguanylate cyclase [Solirubrobacteraceae bacterium]|jgi:diguanylate cyclase (GGDEF)-like protein
MDSDAQGAQAPDDAGRHICCSMTSVILSLVRRECGERGVPKLLAQAGSTRTPAYLEDLNNWVSLDEACALLDAGAHVTGDPGFARRVGGATLSQHAGTQVATLLRSLGSVEALLSAITETAPRFSTATDMEAVEVGPGRAVVRAVAREGFTRRRVHCDWASGIVASAPMLFGLPQANVQESECQARGDAHCLYTVTWDAELAASAADPQLRVTELEAQLQAISARLNSVYAIAGDLISTETVETALLRIVERAADTVRAPSHILAVRPLPGADLQVYSRGIDRRAADALARATLANKPTPTDSTLVVEVASSRRAYGQLIARYPGGIAFFAQEREALELYAKHAAAVLDMALARQESVQRHEQVSSLLALSHALAAAGTSVEVAERLAAAIPDVIDCDRTAVWLWNAPQRSLQVLASWGQTAETGPALAGLRIVPGDTTSLQRMLTHPQPILFEQSTDDPFVGGLMRSLEVVALTVVPIIARGAFLGILTVSVCERPERLRLRDDLLERLTGIAALAAPAIQNGQLVDQLNHKASHDGLTGLLNRVGFRHRIDAALARADASRRVGLLFIDLNDFKRVNDLHGHEAGDQIIRQAGARLNTVCRGEDQVARLGGDEFAVILADIDTDEQVRAAQRRVRAAFADPFLVDAEPISVSASVGGGVWPEDGRTVRELIRYADIAMYEDKASGRQAREAARAPARTH